MTGPDKQEYPPLLAAGFHRLDAQARQRLCADRFPYSTTRPRILKNVEAIVSDVNVQGIQGEIWVDGSFLTEKLNPDDADIALVIAATALRALTPTQRSYFDAFRKTSLYDRYKIDNYGLAIDASDPQGQWLYAYWLRQFGFSRSNEMKGILQISVPFVVTP
jgi:hypothetical protein